MIISTRRINYMVSTYAIDELPEKRDFDFAGQVTLIRHTELREHRFDRCNGTLWIQITSNELQQGTRTTRTLSSICERFPNASDVRIIHDTQFTDETRQLPVIGFGNNKADLSALEYDWETLMAAGERFTIVIGPFRIEGLAWRSLMNLYLNQVPGPNAIALPPRASWVTHFDRAGLIQLEP